jgi:hypothetical protein
MKAAAEVPFGGDASVRDVAAEGSLPQFVEYLLITVK